MTLIRMKRSVGARALFGLALATCAVPPSHAEGPDHTGQIAAFYEEAVADWISSEPIIAAIRLQNEQHAELTAAEIDELDKAWRAEIASEGNDRPFVQRVMDNAASKFLKQQQRQANWMIVEIIVMDAKGLNVALSTPSSDYWQGDEDKHQKTFQAGTDEPFIDAVEYEAETGLLLSQVNRTLFDPTTGAPIGAVTVSVNMNKL